jgi:protein-disulfide isomerase-like protein with CxxC motif
MPKKITEVVHVEFTEEETLQLVKVELLLKQTRNIVKSIQTRRYSDGLDVLNNAIEGLYAVYSEFAVGLPESKRAEIDQEIEDLDNEYNRL